MASTCVPGFTPITIDKKHLIEEYGNCPNKPEPPKLVDALTNLTGLSKNQIESLAKHSSWLAEAQIRLYMPMLITERS